MFTFEIRVGGTLLAHIYGVNVCDVCGVDDLGKILEEELKKHKCSYTYEYYETSTRKVISGTVKHYRGDNIRKLIVLILKDVEKKNSD